MILPTYRDKKDGILDGALTTDGTVFSPPLKRPKIMSAPPHNERVMLYVRQEGDEVYTPLHVVPPSTQGLLNAVSSRLSPRVPSSALNRSLTHSLMVPTDKLKQ